MARRIIGLVLMLVAILGLALCIWGVKMGNDLVDSLAVGIESAAEATVEVLDTVALTIEQSRETVSGVYDTVSQVQQTTENLSTSVDDTQPALDELGVLVGEVIPGTIEDVQTAIPNIAQTAKVVDETLRFLSKLKIEETVPIINYEISLGLGVDYDPEIPFDQAIAEVGVGLGPIAEVSKNLEEDLKTTGGNMVTLSEDLSQLAGSLGAMNEELVQFNPLLDEYSALVDDVQRDIADGQESVQQQLAVLKRMILLAAVWLGLFQLLPLYFGLELAMGNRMVAAADWPQGLNVPGVGLAHTAAGDDTTGEVAISAAKGVEDVDGGGGAS